MEVSIEPSPRSRGESIWAEYQDQGLMYITVVALTPDGPPTDAWVRWFVEKNQLTHPVLVDSEGIFRRRGAFPCPMDILIAPDLEVRRMGRLPLTEQFLDNEVAGAFGP